MKTVPLWLDAAKATAIFAGLFFPTLPLLIYLERKICAGIQSRVGPNRVGPKGLLQPFADAIKMIVKEDIIPSLADKFLYVLAPAFVLLPPLVAFCVIPVGNYVTIAGYPLRLQAANLGDLGLLALLAVSGIGVYGLAFGGWASNNKFSLLGGLRSSAQLVSYELTLGLTVIAMMVYLGTGDPAKIVEQQVDLRWGFVPGWNIFNPLLWPAAILFYVSSLAENNRLPFDLPEADAELVGGYHTEYASLKFALFMAGEYVAVVTMSALFVTLFLGGWDAFGLVRPGDHRWLAGVVSLGAFGAKVALVIFLTMWVRWTYPRVRWTDLMNIGWKFFLEVAFALVLVYGLRDVIGWPPR